MSARDLNDPINGDLINFVIIYQSAVRFPIYTPSPESLLTHANHRINVRNDS